VSYQIDPSHVAHERLGDEVIIINLDKGAYYSGSGSAADLWSLLVTGASLNHIIDILSKEYRHSPEAVRSDVERCVAALVAAELIQADRTFGKRILVPSPEVTLAYSLNHGFRRDANARADL
jgi:hypothetical protein